MNVQKEFEDKFDTEILDLLVLTKESADEAVAFHVKNMLQPSVRFAATVNLSTNEFSSETGKLEWMIENSPNLSDWGFNFKEYQIYHIKARKNLSDKSKTDMSCYMVVEVFSDHIFDPRLEALREQLVKPITIEHESVGTFHLNRRFSWFEGTVSWMKNCCSTFLCTDKKDGETAKKTFSIFLKLFKDQTAWDNKFRIFAAEELTDQANEWYENDDDSKYEDEDFDEDADEIFITKEEFAKRIHLSELIIRADGSLTLYYNDNNMFYGHAIEIDVSSDGKMGSASITG